MLTTMKSREQQVEEVHALLRELSREEGSERAEAVLEDIKAFDFFAARHAAESYDLDGVRRAVEGLERLRESQGDRAGCEIYDFGPLHKAMARFDELAEIIGNPELAFQAVLAYKDIVDKLVDLWGEQFDYRGTAGTAKELREPWVEDPDEWKDFVAKVLSRGHQRAG